MSFSKTRIMTTCLGTSLYVPSPCVLFKLHYFAAPMTIMKADPGKPNRASSQTLLLAPHSNGISFL